MFLFSAVNPLILVSLAWILNFYWRKKPCKYYFKKNEAIVLSMLSREIVVRMCVCVNVLFILKCWSNHVKTDNETHHYCIIML